MGEPRKFLCISFLILAFCLVGFACQYPNIWGSDTENEVHDPWASIRQIGTFSDPGSDEPSKFASSSCRNDDFASKDKKPKNRKLTRKKSFRRLPGFRRFSFRLRLKRLRIMICGKIF